MKQISGWLLPNGQLKKNPTTFATGKDIVGTGKYKDMITGTNFSNISSSIDPKITDIMKINSLTAPTSDKNVGNKTEKFEVFGATPEEKNCNGKRWKCSFNKFSRGNSC